MSQNYSSNDHTAAYAEAFFIANLLFIGVFYMALWVLYFLRYKQTSVVGANHLKQALMVSTISTLIVITLNIIILLTSGYVSATALITAEVYLMVIVPIFLFFGVQGFVKAIHDEKYKYPLIGGLVSC